MQLSARIKDKVAKSLIENFVPRFVPCSVLVYADDECGKENYFDEALLKNMGVTIDSHGKMPDLVLYYPARDWLLLVESTTSNGPIDEERLEELARIFSKAKPGLVYVTAFQSRSDMSDYPDLVAWGTHAWLADEPDHMIHFNGSRFLGPYS